MKTKDDIEFTPGMMLYLAAGGRIVEMNTRGMGYTEDSISIGFLSYSPARMWYAKYENAAQEAIEQLRTQITDLHQDIEAFQREITRRTKKATHESGRRGSNSSVLRSDALHGPRDVPRRTITVAVC